MSHSSEAVSSSAPVALPKVYIADISLVTSVARDANSLARVVAQNKNNFRLSDYYTAYGQRLTMGLVPDKILPELVQQQELPASIYLSRMLRLGHAGLMGLSHENKEEKWPLLLSLTEQYPDQSAIHPKFVAFLRNQMNRDGGMLDWVRCRQFTVGRAGVIGSIDIAMRYLQQNAQSQLIVGGVDSYQNAHLIEHLSQDNRLMAEGCNGFVAGEAAAFIRLTADKNKALKKQGGVIALSQPGLAQEQGHIYSDQPNRGQGLTQAIRGALQYAQEPEINTVYTTLNTETLWLSEHTSAIMRNASCIARNADLLTAARSIGDIGAASGGVLLALAAEHLFQQRQEQSQLVYTTSDQAHRSAICLHFETA